MGRLTLMVAVALMVQPAYATERASASVPAHGSAKTVRVEAMQQTVENKAAYFDEYVQNTETGTDHSASADLRLGTFDAGTTRAKSYLSWIGLDYLWNKSIDSAVLHLYATEARSCATPWRAWETNYVNQTVQWGANEPVWNFIAGTSDTTLTTCVNTWVSIDVRKVFAKLAAAASWNTANIGLDAENMADSLSWKRFASNNVSGKQPYVVLTYSDAPTVSGASTSPATGCASGSSRPVIGTRTPTLRAIGNDDTSAEVSVTFEWWSVGGAAPLGSKTITGARGSVFSTTLPTGVLSHGGAYSWRARARDSFATGQWSALCEFTINVGAPAVAGCVGTGDGDFNGDGQRDVAIADPFATVGGLARAGAVYLSYGGSGAIQVLDENLTEVPGTAQANARFGHAIEVYDANDDGCSDLAIGLPFKSSGAIADAGVVYLLYGSPAGLGKGPAAVVHSLGAGVAYDWFGYSLAGGQTADREPFLIIGAPGDDIGASNDAGSVTYVRGDVNLLVDQAVAGTTVEPDDRAGYSVAASPMHFAFGSPGENGSASTPFAGGVCVLTHAVTAGKPGRAGCIHQDVAGVSNAMEAGDQFGKSVALAAFWPSGDSLLAVGVPGEGLGSPDVADCGLVMQFRVSATGITQLAEISQSTAGISGGNEQGDLFGEKVVLVNTDPSVEPMASTLLIVVGSPGEDLGPIDAGGVHVFAAGTATVGSETVVSRGPNSLPGSPGEQELIGLALGSSRTELFVAAPYGPARAVYALRWTDLAAGNAVPARSWQPGSGGIPATAVTFGTEVR